MITSEWKWKERNHFSTPQTAQSDQNCHMFVRFPAPKKQDAEIHFSSSLAYDVCSSEENVLRVSVTELLQEAKAPIDIYNTAPQRRLLKQWFQPRYFHSMQVYACRQCSVRCKLKLRKSPQAAFLVLGQLLHRIEN